MGLSNRIKNEEKQEITYDINYDVKETQEYQEGRIGYKNNKKNPYKVGDNRRYSWFMGFYDERWKKFYE